MKNGREIKAYKCPRMDIVECKGTSFICTSDIDALAIDNALGSIDEITFTDFNQTF